MYREVTNLPGMIAIQRAELDKMLNDAYNKGLADGITAAKTASAAEKEAKREAAKKNGKTAKAKVKTEDGKTAEYRSTVAEKK